MNFYSTAAVVLALLSVHASASPRPDAIAEAQLPANSPGLGGYSPPGAPNYGQQPSLQANPNYQSPQQSQYNSRSPQGAPQPSQYNPGPSQTEGPRPGGGVSYSQDLTPGRPSSSPKAPPPPPANPPPGTPTGASPPAGGTPPPAPAPAAGAGGCPPVWTQISQDLTTMFVQADGQCNDAARAAVRATFHDCGTWTTAQGNTGGCDGSLILSAEENARPENRGLQAISMSLGALAKLRKVGVADMLAYAGAHATVSCPLGPTVPIKIGRTDSATAGNDAVLPANATLNADTILSLFSDKGFSPPEVAALVGAHSTSKQFFADPARAGQPQDSTPGVWDVKFYSDTTAPPPGVAVFPSDMSLAADSRSGPTFKSFVNAQTRWNMAFADTFSKLSMLGNDQAKMVDCTSTLPKPRTTFP